MNLFKISYSIILIFNYTFLFSQDITLKDKITFDNSNINVDLSISELLNSGKEVFLSKDKRVKIVFLKDSSIEIYNQIDISDRRLIKKGRYKLINSSFIKHGCFIFCDIKNENDTIEISDFKNGLRSGLVKTFYSKNRMKMTAETENGKFVGTANFYDTSGFVIKREIHKQYKRKVNYFYSNGTLKCTGQFAYKSYLDSVTNINSVKNLFPNAKIKFVVVETPVRIGKWRFYNQKRELNCIKIYGSKGELKTIKVFNEQNEIIDEELF